MKVIELTGPTGIGKSTTATQLVADHDTVGACPVIDLQMAVASVNKMVNVFEPSFHPFCRYLEYLFQQDGPRKDDRRSAIVRALAKTVTLPYISREHYPSETVKHVVIDGGLIHRGWSVAQFLGSAEHPLLEKYFELMPLPMMGVFIMGPKELCATRNKARVAELGANHDRTDRLDMAYAVNNMGLDILKRRGLRLLMLDAHDSPEYNATLIANAADTIQEDKRTRVFTGSTVETYNKRREGTPKYEIEQKIVEGMLEDLPPGSWVLDCPCGTGRFFPFYKEKGLIVKARDKSADMLIEAGKTAKSIGFDDVKLSLCRDDILELKSLPEDHCVDASVMVRLTRWLTYEDCQKAFKQLQRVTRDRIIITARVANHAHARPVELFLDAINEDWKLESAVEGYKPEYKVLLFKRVAKC